MANWELVEITNSTCDECGIPAAVNVYRKKYICQCSACRDRVAAGKIYQYFEVCGYCMPKWLKSRNQFEDIDYGD